MTAALLPPLLAQAESFLGLFYRENRLDGLDDRLNAVQKEVARTGQYTLSNDELTHGARVAWRNSARCVGRLPWPALAVRDLRQVTRPDEIFGHLLTHLHEALNDGHIRPVISVFGPGVRIHNPQLIRYAGYVQPGGEIIGDPATVALTAHLCRLGWKGGSGTRFDVLPLAIESAGSIHLYELPAHAVREVALTHPEIPALGALGLKWHVLPVISDMSLEIGGQVFACAPFNGWYLGTEIAARNLADTERYHQLPEVAQALGLDTSRSRSLWQDRALVELNVAVLHSFDAAGIRISDHHAVTRQFVRFEHQEARAGRAVRGRWSWLVPPLSPATTPVWHRQYVDGDESPRFMHGQDVWADLQETARCPFH
ncbi:nitric oxide synthase oxygenase [Deinococcus arenicola]|uniref:Nitric oxide synthase oxygenase n=1 Tax=Deinococcus arenicola TaxID=2994950 RepID=A0ABU4DRR0_9DEIO|nr:nitric oxide synthase oxygenase [Deinococcus sp. ZS9-10]MDV6374774.1 nitric oxide synthase oxygenase [Deinococcus sp. ZS9-10]